MKITAYVPCRNGESYLPEVLPALLNQTRKADQYLFIDDRSTDRSAAIARDFGFEVKQTGPEHFGLAAGRNVALANAQGDVLAGVDADAVAEPNYLAEIESIFVRRPEIVGLCGRLTEKYANTSIYDFWRSVHMIQHFGDAEVPNPFALFGCSASHRTEFLRKLGGWNPRYEVSFEDMDLTNRIRQANGQTLYAPTCRLWHLKRDTLESLLQQYWNWHAPNQEQFGYYQSVNRWMKGRLPTLWQNYRIMRLQDRPTPKIAIVTCLLPWSVIVRDLHLLFTRHGGAADLGVISVLAQQVLQGLGAEPGPAAWIKQWLDSLIASLPALPGPRGEWNANLLNEIKVAAMVSIPERNYWSAVQSVFERGQ